MHREDGYGVRQAQPNRREQHGKEHAALWGKTRSGKGVGMGVESLTCTPAAASVPAPEAMHLMDLNMKAQHAGVPADEVLDPTQQAHLPLHDLGVVRGGQQSGTEGAQHD